MATKTITVKAASATPLVAGGSRGDVIALIATAVAIGAGDASAAVTAISNAVPSIAGGVQIIFDTSLTKNQLRVALEEAYKSIAFGSDALSS